MKNRIKQFIEERGITAYRFWKDTGLSRPTAYRVCSDADYPVAGEVLDKICDAYRIQPGEILYWVPQSGDEDAVEPDPSAHYVTAPDESLPKRKRGTAARRASREKSEFRIGQMVKNPAGWRGWITKLLDDGKAVVDWEGQCNGDVIPLHMLTDCE